MAFSRLMKNEVCRGAKPLCRESEGVPQISILPPSWPEPVLERSEGKGARGMVERVFQHLAKPLVKRMMGFAISDADPPADGSTENI